MNNHPLFRCQKNSPKTMATNCSSKVVLAKGNVPLETLHCKNTMHWPSLEGCHPDLAGGTSSPEYSLYDNIYVSAHCSFKQGISRTSLNNTKY